MISEILLAISCLFCPSQRQLYLKNTFSNEREIYRVQLYHVQFTKYIALNSVDKWELREMRSILFMTLAHTHTHASSRRALTSFDVLPPPRLLTIQLM